MEAAPADGLCHDDLEGALRARVGEGARSRPQPDAAADAAGAGDSDGAEEPFCAPCAGPDDGRALAEFLARKRITIIVIIIITIIVVIIIISMMLEADPRVPGPEPEGLTML